MTEAERRSLATALQRLAETARQLELPARGGAMP
jgi:hypothetical protein